LFIGIKYAVRLCNWNIILRHRKEKKTMMEELAAGEVDIVVGTHALLAPKIAFGNLGLVVVDEEQRFGVNQKEKLKTLAAGVDVLTLTATPIPRTLQMAMAGLREMSTILTPPPMRRRIHTRVSPAEDEVVAEALERELARGGQCYCVVPRIADMAEVAARVHRLAPAAAILTANGQMTDVEDRLMRFGDGEAAVLVCTPIIEAGLDLPAVNTIIVFHSQRFGLSSLHQLRGRVGRGELQAFALFTYPKGSDVSAESQVWHTW
jgi:transcription-repair coupling factor (superfamily II helicase)